MTLSEHQRLFACMVARFMRWICAETDYEITLGEAYRTPEQHALNVKTGKSLAARSLHSERLAIDLMLWKNGNLSWQVEDYEPLGVYWESLGGVWGGRWPKLRDAVHFQYGGQVRGSVPGKEA